MDAIAAFIPPEGLKILITLALSFLIGIEREESQGRKSHAFGGVRTFPLIGLLGYAMSYLSGPQLLPVVFGFAVIGGFMLLSYWRKLCLPEGGGITTEVSGLLTYVLGVLVQRGDFWVSATLVVLSLLLLELKVWLENLSKRIGGDEILTFTQFLLLTIVILPAVPNEGFTALNLNPHKIWLMIIAVSGISYASYVLQKLLAGRGGVILSAVLGGCYSSTATTISLARSATGNGSPRLYSGAILMASGIMYLRLAALCGLFNPTLTALLLPWFIGLGTTGIISGWLWSRSGSRTSAPGHESKETRNPLELQAAMLFALLFVVLVAATHWATSHLGTGGLFAIAGIGGTVDVDPFVLSMTQAGGRSVPLATAAAAILTAASSNNVMKGAYAWFFARNRAGWFSLCALLALAALGLLPLLWLR